jgi:shikimate kinase/shikimate 5-dehydrogenase
MFIVGHRGVGKTTFLQRLSRYFSDHKIFDLDQEISKYRKLSIKEIWLNLGEKKFREIEQEVFNKIINHNINQNIICSLGAGYMGDLPNDAEVIWLRRDSDRRGRIFLDRPLYKEQDQDYLKDYLSRFDVREEYYNRISTQIWTIPEGLVTDSKIEEAVLTRQNLNKIKGTVTVLPLHLRRKNYLKHLSYKIENTNCLFELRSDLLKLEEVKLLSQEIPSERLIISYRRNSLWGECNIDLKSKFVDWDLDLAISLQNKQINKNNLILSLHSKHGSSLEQEYKKIIKFENECEILKWAPEIKTLSELKEAHDLSLLNRKIELYPISTQEISSQWQWYRLLNWHRNILNFWREDEGSSLDQPTLAQVLMQADLKKHTEYEAILGSPVVESFSPAYHFQKSNERLRSFYSIEISQEELNEKSFNFLVELGLKQASVTSPLKEVVLQLPNIKACDHVQWLQMTNTLINVNENKFLAFNTDWNACVEIFKDKFCHDEIIIWGQGAMAKLIQKLFQPNPVLSCSSRNPQNYLKFDNLNCLIWAAGPESNSPPIDFPKPKKVVDLSYSARSQALRYCLKHNIAYESGLNFFKIQAQKQAELFSSQQKMMQNKEVL